MHFVGLRNASWASLGRPCGRRKGAESHLSRASNTQLVDNMFLEKLWNVSKAAFGKLLEDFRRKTQCIKENSGNVNSYKNICVFTIGLHVDVAVYSFRNIERSMSCRCGACKLLTEPSGLPSSLIFEAYQAPKTISDEADS